MPASPVSNIRAFVHWKDSSVYSGEEIECIITFKNVASSQGHEDEAEDGSQTPNGGLHSRRQSYVPSAAHSRKSSVAQMKPPPLSRAASAASAKGGRGHRPTLSLNLVSGHGKNGALQSAPLQATAPPIGALRSSKGHTRSLSIMSLGSEQVIEGRSPTTDQISRERPGKIHARSASLQHTPTLMAQSLAGHTTPLSRQPSPLHEATTPPPMPGDRPMQLRPPRRRPGTVSADNTPRLERQPTLKKGSGNAAQEAPINNFQFPHNATGLPSLDSESRPKRSPATMHSGQQRSHSPRPADLHAANNLNPITRVMSEVSSEGTPRTSSEFYSMSNHSDETLTSELPLQQQIGRLLPKMPHSRQPSRSAQRLPAKPETLMMAYARTVGQFTLDGSLVNAAPFEEVKRKGVQGGGGVIGVEQSKRSSGLFGALSWGNIGESLGGLLGGDEMSSMARMKASASSRSIPLLSTPQSLLFVDLTLAPGESKSYNYRFNLPRGLPPSHRGRAIKVTYHLSIGVQRPTGQSVQDIEIPFRVLGSYDARGDILGHDLMSPYILLQDSARTMTMPAAASSTKSFEQPRSVGRTRHKQTPKQGLEDFLRYTERLVESSQDANGVLLSPSSPASPEAMRARSWSRQDSTADPAGTTVKEAIDFAILRSNVVSNPGKPSQSQSSNRFNIARSGQPVAVLTILRPAYRLGEAVIGTIDFTAPTRLQDSAPPAPCYSALVELETAELVDPSLALRSSHSIHRVTRKVHAWSREHTAFARQISFNLVIPPSAAPSFETTGISLVWRLRIEFTTQRQVQGLGLEDHGTNEELLEELASDDRGTTYIAKERLMADTFEIAVPLKVYGAAGIEATTAESEPLII